MSKQSATIVVNKGEVIPFDGIVVDGTALVDESAVAGVSKPALIDSEDGRNQVITGGLIVDGWLKVEGTTQPPQPPPSEPTQQAPKTSTSRKSCETECSCDRQNKPDPVLRWIYLLTLIIATTGICAVLGYALSSHSWVVTAVSGVVGFLIGISQIWRPNGC
jgi:hypothetical protein